MDDSVILDMVQFTAVKVSAATGWFFAEVFDRDGASATAEIGSRKGAMDVAERIAELVGLLAGQPLAGDEAVGDAAGVDPGLLTTVSTTSVAVSAVRSVVTILQAVHAGVSLTETLGGTTADSVELYGNINRTLLDHDRSPASFGKTAERVAGRGFRTIKCTPFDEVDESKTGELAVEASHTGVERVAAVRSAIGPDIRLLVDCHRRFDLESAPTVAEELAKLDVGWFEEPVDTETQQDDMAAVARQVSMPVAAGESLYGVGSFEALLGKGAAHVIMPDVMLCGGASEAHRAGVLARRLGAGFSPHSPSGPVALLTSAHVCAASPGTMALEHAVDEAPWRHEVLDPPERVVAGRLWFPGGPGLGATLSEATIRRRGRRWS